MALKTTKLRDLSAEELDKEEQQQREAIWKLQLQMTTGQLQDPFKVKLAKKDLARVMTIRRERELSSKSGKS